MDDLSGKNILKGRKFVLKQTTDFTKFQFFKERVV